MNHYIDFNKTLQNQLLLTLWIQSNSRWPAQQSDISEHENGYNSINRVDMELKFSVTVAEVSAKHTVLWAPVQLTHSQIIAWDYAQHKTLT